VTACQRWRHRQHSWRRTSEGGFNPDHYGVAEIADDTTPKAFIETHHYSGSYVSALRRYGLYDITGPAPGLVGVAVLSYPTNDAVLLKPFPGLAKGDESAELGRLVLLDEVPANAESHFMAEVFRLAADVGYRGIVSFSDPNPRHDDDGRLTMPGHLGIVYQALNARYTGDTGRRTVHVLPDGTVLSTRAVQKIRDQDQGHRYAEEILISYGARPMRAGEIPRLWLQQALIDAKVRNVREDGKHRYLFAIGNRTQRRHVRIAMDPRPYPKNWYEQPVLF
jgi:hypothetical protein